jgi:hypothetical protein
MRVLVAEDHDRLARAVAAGLRRYGMTVDVAIDGDARYRADGFPHSRCSVAFMSQRECGGAAGWSVDGMPS